MDYQHSPAEIQIDINRLIDHLEANSKLFSERLAEVEASYPNLHYQEQLYRLHQAIAQLKRQRDALGSIDWI